MNGGRGVIEQKFGNSRRPRFNELERVQPEVFGC